MWPLLYPLDCEIVVVTVYSLALAVSPFLAQYLICSQYILQDHESDKAIGMMVQWLCQWNGSDRDYGDNGGGGSTVMVVLAPVVIGMVGAVVEVLMAYKC